MDAHDDDHVRPRRRRRCPRRPRTVPLAMAAVALLLMCGPSIPSSGSGRDGSPFVSSFGFGGGSVSRSRGARNGVGWGTRGWSLPPGTTSPPQQQPHVTVPTRPRGLLMSKTDDDGDEGDEESSLPPPWFLSAMEEEGVDGGASHGRGQSTENTMKGADVDGIGGSDDAEVDDDSGDDDEPPLVEKGKSTRRGSRSREPAGGPLNTPTDGRRAEAKKSTDDSVFDNEDDKVPGIEWKTVPRVPGSYKPEGTPLNASSFEHVEDKGTIVDSSTLDENANVVEEESPAARGASVSSGTGSYKPFRLLKPLTSQRAENKKNVSDGIIDKDGATARGASVSSGAGGFKPAGTLLDASKPENVEDGGTMVGSAADDESGNVFEDKGASSSSEAGSYKPFRLLKPLTTQQAESKKNVSDDVVDEDGPRAQGASSSRGAGSYKPTGTLLNPSMHQQLGSKQNVSDSVIDEDGQSDQGVSKSRGAGGYRPAGTFLSPLTNKYKMNISESVIDRDSPSVPPAAASRGAGSYKPGGALLNPLSNQRAENKKNVSDSAIDEGAPSVQEASESRLTGSYRPAGTLLNPLTNEHKKNVSDIDSDNPSAQGASTSRGAGSYKPAGTLLNHLTDENKMNITDSVVNEDGPNFHVGSASRGTGSYRPAETHLNPMNNEQAESKKNVSDSAMDEDGMSARAESVPDGARSYRPKGTLLDPLTNEHKKNISDDDIDADGPSVQGASASRTAGSYRPAQTLLNPTTNKQAENKKKVSDSAIDEDGLSVPAASASRGARSYTPLGTLLNPMTNEHKKNVSESDIDGDGPSLPGASESLGASSYRPAGTILNSLTNQRKTNLSDSNIDKDGANVPGTSTFRGARSYTPAETILDSLTNQQTERTKNVSDSAINDDAPSVHGASKSDGAGSYRPAGTLLNSSISERKMNISSSVVDEDSPSVQGGSTSRGAGSYRPAGSLLNPSMGEHSPEAETVVDSVASDDGGDKVPYFQRELVSRGSGSYEPVGSLLNLPYGQQVDELAISDFIVSEDPIMQGASVSRGFDPMTRKRADEEEAASDEVVDENNNDECSFITGELISRGSMRYEPVGSLLNHPAEQTTFDEAATGDFLIDEGLAKEGKSGARGPSTNTPLENLLNPLTDKEAGEEGTISDSVLDHDNSGEGPSVTGELISRGSMSYEPVGSLLNHPAEQNTNDNAATSNFVIDEGPITQGKSLARGFPSYKPAANLLNPLTDKEAKEEEAISDSSVDDDSDYESPSIPEDLISRGSRSYEPVGSLLNHPAEQNAVDEEKIADFVVDEGTILEGKSVPHRSRSYRPAGNLLNPLTNQQAGGDETISHSVVDGDNGDEGPAFPEELISRGSRSYEPVGSLLNVPTEQQIVDEEAISGFVVNEGPIIQGISVSRGSTSYKPSGRLLDRSRAMYSNEETIIDIDIVDDDDDDDCDEDPVVEEESVSRRSEENGPVGNFLDPPATYEEVVSEFSNDDEAPNIQGVSEYPSTRRNKPSGTQLNFSIGNQAEDEETLRNGVVEDEEAIAQAASASHSSSRTVDSDDDSDESTVVRRTLASHGYMSYKPKGSLPNPPTEQQQTDEGPSAVQGIDSVRDGNKARKEGREIVKRRRKMQLSWCDASGCYTTSIRETVVGPENHITFDGPATGQVMYTWIEPDGDASTTNDHRLYRGSGDAVDDDRDRTATVGLDVATLPTDDDVEPNSSSRNDRSYEDSNSKQSEREEKGDPGVAAPSVLLLVKKGDDELTKIAADAVRDLTADNLRVWLHPDLAARLKYYFGVEDDERIRLFEPSPYPGFGASHQHSRMGWGQGRHSSSSFDKDSSKWTSRILSMKKKTRSNPDLVVTLGGDGLLMYASSLFPGPVPPILCVAGGSLGFLTPFAKEEMLDAVKRSLGLIRECQDSVGASIGGGDSDNDPPSTSSGDRSMGSVLPGMGCYAGGMEDGLPTENSYKHLNSYWGGAITVTKHGSNVGFGADDKIALSMRMRLDCRIINPEGVVRARYNVLNEVVIDRGSSPYLANLECFCDDVHLTTVQADGIIFSTPTGSTAYSMAAGGSVVHPAVPAILVTPICPHVLSFRSMVFPDHVVLRTYVPDDARAGAFVAFDGKHRRELHRGDSVQIQMSVHPVPTINRVDQTFDWLNSLKRNFNFNSRVQQKPL